MRKIRQWLPLFSTNFFGVITDNFLKNLICFIGIYWVSQDNQSLVVSMAAGMLVVPFILFSPLAGRISYSTSKLSIVKYAKGLAIIISVIAALGFIFQSIVLVMAAMFLMGFQSTIYSPAKYGLIRDIGGKDGISFGTGTLEMLTFIGALVGTVIAGMVADINKIAGWEWSRNYVIAGLFLLVSLISWGASFSIKAAESEPESIDAGSLNPIIFLKDSYRFGLTIPGLNPVVIGIATFWLIASLVQMNIVIHCPQVLGMSSSGTSLIIGLMSIGIGLGCGVAGILSRKKVQVRLVIVGGSGLTVLMFILGVTSLHLYVFGSLVALSAFFSGFMMVPLNSWLQVNVLGRKLGGVIAAQNLLVFIFLLVSAILFGTTEKVFGSTFVFLLIGVITLCVTVFMYFNIPGIRKEVD